MFYQALCTSYAVVAEGGGGGGGGVQNPPNLYQKILQK